MSAPAEPTVLDVAESSRFEIHVDGRTAGFAAYRMKDPRLMVLTLDDARSRGLSVRPDCPFVRAYIARHPDDYLALVPEELRPRLDL